MLDRFEDWIEAQMGEMISALMFIAYNLKLTNTKLRTFRIPLGNVLLYVQYIQKYT